MAEQKVPEAKPPQLRGFSTYKGRAVAYSGPVPLQGTLAPRVTAMASSSGRRITFFPRADASILSSKPELLPTYPRTTGPVWDPDNVDKPIGPWPSDTEASFYPAKAGPYAPAPVPDAPVCLSDRYLRAFLAKNERLRLSMLWYYTRDILKEREFLAGLREKTLLAQECTGWEFVVIGILDLNFYVRLATIGLPLAILPRGEIICAHTVTQPLGVSYPTCIPLPAEPY